MLRRSASLPDRPGDAADTVCGILSLSGHMAFAQIEVAGLYLRLRLIKPINTSVAPNVSRLANDILAPRRAGIISVWLKIGDSGIGSLLTLEMGLADSLRVPAAFG